MAWLKFYIEYRLIFSFGEYEIASHSEGLCGDTVVRTLVANMQITGLILDFLRNSRSQSFNHDPEWVSEIRRSQLPS